MSTKVTINLKGVSDRIEYDALAPRTLVIGEAVRIEARNMPTAYMVINFVKGARSLNA